MGKFTRDQYDKLVAAYSTGVLEADYDGKLTKFRSLGEMQTIIREMELDLGIRKKTGRRVVPTYDRWG